MLNYTKLNTETAKDFAYRALRNEIMTTSLQPGILVSETELANALSISRTPVREALMMLRNEHLITVTPQLGSFVTLIEWELIDQAAFMRGALEEAALHKACKNFTDESMYHLERNILTQKLLVKQNFNEVDFHTLDQEFHSILFEGINKSEVWQSIHNISTHYNRLRILVDKKSEKDLIIEQHQVYIDIIKNKDTSKISKIIREHILDPIKHWPEFVNENPDIKSFIK